MNDWFTIESIDQDTYVISEYKHWEETHCYLLNGTTQSLLLDTGLGICNISKIVARLTNNPVTAIATHIHWDHIGGLAYYPNFYVHEKELSWLSGEFPLPLELVKKNITECCALPKDFDIHNYHIFQGKPTAVLHGGEEISLGNRTIKVLHTPGHSPGHMCFWEKEKGYLFTGDLVYKGTLAAWFPSTDPEAYLNSLETVSQLPAKQVFPAHHSLDIQPEIIIRMKDVLQQLKTEGKLHHGGGTFSFREWSIKL